MVLKIIQRKMINVFYKYMIQTMIPPSTYFFHYSHFCKKSSLKATPSGLEFQH